jgi:hypothetical protein
VAKGDQFIKCPKGHTLPNRTNKGQCTPLHCAGSRSAAQEKNPVRAARKKAKAAAPTPADAVLDAVKPAPAPDQVLPELAKAAAYEAKMEALEQIAKSMSRLEAREVLLNVPKGLKGAEAEAWADAKLQELLPWAVAEKEFQLKHGDDEQRSRAADRVLEANGRGKKEGAPPVTQPIVVVLHGSGGSAQLPWSKGKVIDAQVQHVLPEKT